MRTRIRSRARIRFRRRRPKTTRPPELTPCGHNTAGVRERNRHRNHKPQTADTLSAKSIVNYQPSLRETNTVTAPVRIKRISVAAVLDGTYDGGHFKPLDAERLKSIQNLVAAAVGADLERGDLVDIQSAALSQPYVPPVPNPVTQLRSLMADPLHLYSALGVGFFLLIADALDDQAARSAACTGHNCRAAREAAPKAAETASAEAGRNVEASGARAQPLPGELDLLRTRPIAISTA